MTRHLQFDSQLPWKREHINDESSFFFLTLSVLHSSVFLPHGSTHSQLMAARFSVGQRLEAFNDYDLGLQAGGTEI